MTTAKDSPQPLLEILRKTADFFSRAGIEQPRLDAELLLADTLGCKRLELYLRHEQPLFEEHLAPLRDKVKRRARREPLQYILGCVDFHGVQLKVDNRVLIPRPETEHLVELLIERAAQEKPQRILDLGTGSGAIALALAKALPECQVVAVDQSADALEVARANAVANQLQGRVEWHCGSWFEPLPEATKFDWIVSNPPYLTESEWQDAAPEVREHEPYTALVADAEGSADLLWILQQSPRFLQPEGSVFLETGIAQHPQLTEHARQIGFKSMQSLRDYHQHPRFFCASFRLPPPNSTP
jgi:release factor glutamine methyltransferase